MNEQTNDIREHMPRGRVGCKNLGIILQLMVQPIILSTQDIHAWLPTAAVFWYKISTTNNYFIQSS